MKTLDEVIAELEDEKVFTDALHYLRIFQAHVQRVRDQLDALKDEYRPNDPLTWEQLKQMEGKPVWVEVLSDEIDLSSRWMLVARETKAHSLPLAYTDDICHWFYVHEDKLGKAWQAYRKERG